ncbi:MAG: N-acetyltransferase [Syntrophobacterales bacterium]|nr:N-acetyltransferase [Syntrophobacterales bacterium]
MEFRQHTQNDSSAIESLFTSVFAKSEGEAEGELIENLSKELMLETAEDDLFGFVAVDKNQIVGSIFFSRLYFQNDNNIEAFILAPVAVHSDFQGKSIGQELINHGLNVLRKK